MILRIIFWCLVIVLGFYIIGAIMNNGDLKSEYKTHIQNSINYDNYVVMSFDSFSNMDKVDKKYFSFNRRNDSWIISHEEVHFREDYYRSYTTKTAVVMRTKKDYKKLKEYLTLSNGKNIGDAIYNNSNDEAMEEIIKHYRDVAERNRIEAQKRVDDAIQTYMDVKGNIGKV